MGHRPLEKPALHRKPQRGWYRPSGCAAVVLLLTSCGEQGTARHVVLYSSIDEGYAREVIARFEELNGIRVDLVSDTEAAKSTGLVNRLLAEKERPVADVFWSGDPMRATALSRAGIGMVVALPQPVVAARVRMIIINNTQAGPETQWPRGILDLARADIAPKACLANPLFGTTSMHLAALFERLGDEKAKAFLREFTANGGRMLASNGEVRRRVSSGEFAFGLTDSDDVSVAIADGKPVTYLVPDLEEWGAIVIPTVPVLIRSCPHPDEARELTEFLVSPEVEAILAASTAAHFPGNPSVEPPAVFGSLRIGNFKVAPLDPEAVSRRMEALQDGFLRDWASEQTSDR